MIHPNLNMGAMSCLQTISSMFIPRESNVGGRSLINTNVSNHWDALYKVKSTFKLPERHGTKRIKPLTQNKKEIFQTHEHLRNLMSLHARMQEIGSWKDRLKNPYDPVAHPVLFFRKVSRSASKNSSKSDNKERPKTSSLPKSSWVKRRKHTIDLEPPFAVPVQQLRDFLPILTSFSDSDIKTYTQALVAAVEYFKIRDLQQLEQLQRAALRCVPEHYPPNFQSILKVVIVEIGKHL